MIYDDSWGLKGPNEAKNVVKRGFLGDFPAKQRDALRLEAYEGRARDDHLAATRPKLKCKALDTSLEPCG